MIRVQDFVSMNEGLTKFVVVDTTRYDDSDNFVRKRLTCRNWTKYWSRKVDNYLVDPSTDTIELFIS